MGKRECRRTTPNTDKHSKDVQEKEWKLSIVRDDQFPTGSGVALDTRSKKRRRNRKKGQWKKKRTQTQ